MPGRRGYPDYKASRGLHPVCDWTGAGTRCGASRFLTANENHGAMTGQCVTPQFVTDQAVAARHCGYGRT